MSIPILTEFESIQDTSLLGFRESLQTGRLGLGWSEPFTIPDTFGIKARGGAIFEQGLVVGFADPVIPGAIRYDITKNALELRTPTTWERLASFPVTRATENAIVTFGADGGLQASNAILDGGDLSGLNTVETKAVVPPTGQALQLDNIQWPTGTGVAGDLLRFTAPGVLSIVPSTPGADLVFDGSSGGWTGDRLLVTAPTVDSMFLSQLSVNASGDLSTPGDIGATNVNATDVNSTNLTATETVSGNTGSFQHIFGVTGDIDYVTGETGSFNFVSGDTGDFGYLCSVTGKFDTVIPPAGSQLQLGDALLRFPNTDGTTGQFITTDGSGNLSFSNDSGQGISFNTAGGMWTGGRLLKTTNTPDEEVLTSINVSDNTLSNLSNVVSVGVSTNALKADTANQISIDDDTVINDKTLEVTTYGLPFSFQQTTTNSFETGAGYVIPSSQFQQDVLGQTFTAPATGFVRYMTVGVRTPVSNNGTFGVAIYELTAGLNSPLNNGVTATFLGESVVEDVVSNTTIDVSFLFSTPVQLTSGNNYALIFSTQPVPIGETVPEFQTFNSAPVGSLGTVNRYIGIGVTPQTYLLKFSMPIQTTDRTIRFLFGGTPANTADPAGVVGDFTYDANYMYLKTSSGWGRVALDYAF